MEKCGRDWGESGKLLRSLFCVHYCFVAIMHFEYSSLPLSAEYWTQDMISSLYRRRVTGFTGSHIVRAIATSPLYKVKGFLWFPAVQGWLPFLHINIVVPFRINRLPPQEGVRRKFELVWKKSPTILVGSNGVYVVEGCGWEAIVIETIHLTHILKGNSISCDLGTDYLKRNFEGTLGYVESFRSWCRRYDISSIFNDI